MAINFENRVAIVTGGATGIGHAISEALIGDGVKVIVLDIHPDTSLLCSKIGCKGFTCNILDKVSIQAIVDDIINEYGKVDIQINNAGIVRLAAAEKLSIEDWDATIDINLKAHFQMCQLVIPYLKKQKYGRIVNISSQAALVGLDGHVAYCASKAGIDGITRVLALELGPYQITTNSVAPTVILTELGKKAWAGEKGEQMKAKIPIRRFGKPEDVANAVLFLASDNSSLINGHTLVLDGGYTIQ